MTVIQSCNENEYYASLELIKAPDSKKADGQPMFDRSVQLPDTALKIPIGMFAGYKTAIVWTEQGACVCVCVYLLCIRTWRLPWGYFIISMHRF